MMRSATLARSLTRSDRAKISRWLRRIKERVRAGHGDKRDNYLVRGDDDLSEAIVDYSSIAVFGWTWPGEERLAKILNESARNVRKRIARLRVAGLLTVIPPRGRWRSNRYVPMLDGRSLFKVNLTPEQARDAMVAQRDAAEAEEPPPPRDSGTPVPPDEAHAFQPRRNERSAESSGSSPQERDSPTPYPAPAAAPEAPPREGELLDLDLQEASSTGEPGSAPTSDSSTTSTEKPGPHDEPDIRAEPDNTGQAGAPVVEFSFARLMRGYPHPPGGCGIEHEAYRGHARNAWNILTPAQKHDAERAAPNAPGKEWLGHWLNSGRETGKFEIVDQRAVVPRVWVRKDTRPWEAWVKHYGANGRRPLTTQQRIGGELQTGWWFASEWPPSVENAERVGGMS
jgi:hypothetical protein